MRNVKLHAVAAKTIFGATLGIAVGLAALTGTTLPTWAANAKPVTHAVTKAKPASHVVVKTKAPTHKAAPSKSGVKHVSNTHAKKTTKKNIKPIVTKSKKSHTTSRIAHKTSTQNHKTTRKG